MTALRGTGPTPRVGRDGGRGRPRRLSRLTGLRLFAALAVVLVHVGYHFSNSHPAAVAEGYGYTGVTFFYLLSGFVLAWSQREPRPRRFFWNRFSRIWPLTMLLSAFALTVVAGQERVPGAGGVALDFLLLQAWWPRTTWYFGGNGVSWSLSCEFFFYLLFPLAIRPLRRLGPGGLLGVGAAVLALQAAAPALAGALGMPHPLYFWLFFIFPPYRFLEFLEGMILARALAVGVRLPRPRAAAVVALLGLALVWSAATVYTVRSGTYLDRPFVALAVVPPLALLLVAAASQDLAGVRSWLSSPVLVALGESSFALYLVHKPLFLATARLGWWRNPGQLQGVALLVGFLAVAVGAACLLHYLLERPVEQRLRRLPLLIERWRGTGLGVAEVLGPTSGPRPGG